MPHMNLSESVVLSYLIGLAPLGEEIFCKHDAIAADLADLGLGRSNTVDKNICGLIVAGAVERPARSRYIVRKRLEDFSISNEFLSRTPSYRQRPTWRTFG